MTPPRSGRTPHALHVEAEDEEGLDALADLIADAIVEQLLAERALARTAAPFNRPTRDRR